MQDLIDWIKKTGLENIVWATDLDKTVLDTSPDPNKMAPAPGLEETCRILESRTAGFYVITGRDADYVDKVVFPHSHMRLSAEYHNMARYEPFGAAQDLGPRPQWDLVDPEMDGLVAANAGLRLRKKPFMRSLHYSQVPVAQRPAVKAMLSESLSAILGKLEKATGQEMELTDGGLIFDMGPKGRDKALGLNEIMEHAQAEHGRDNLVPIYFGDSPGDIPAGLAAKAKGGVFVCVGDSPEVLAVADFVLKDPTECRALFKKVSLTNFNPSPWQQPGIQPS